MPTILITGATGNVGRSVLKHLSNQIIDLKIIAGVRNIDKGNDELSEFNVSQVQFDFENIETFKPALSGIDILFLLRPPQLSDVKKFFKPLVEEAIKSNIKQIVFLSVQGVDNSKIIPHNKIEKLITESGISYTFLRPAYFMQNFTTTLRSDLVNKHRIFLPSKNAKFTLIDVDDIGLVTAKILSEPKKHENKKYELTNNETLTFSEMANQLSKGLGTKIAFISPNLINFFLTKRKEGVPTMFIFVMIMLHYLPRFQKTQNKTDFVKIITGQEPKSFTDFIIDNIAQLK